MLSGGGARGLAHVGVLKVLEQLQIPVDMIAGTSMGSIVGGLYATGMSATEIERELLRVNWDQVFTRRVERRELSQRRKEQDYDVSPLLELGMRNGEIRLPQSAVSSRGLETLLRRYTLPARAIERFDDLPIPFRAVATDMETGAAVVLDRGDLALALRSSMSVPGVFAPTELDRRILGDGGLVNNVPVDVARAMGADLLIVVNIGTPLAPRSSLQSAVGLTSQMVNILTEQNVQRSLASLGPRDVLLAPQLGSLTSADFERTRDLIDLGMAGARGHSDALAALSVAPAVYADWRARRSATPPDAPRMAFVRIEGSEQANPERLAMLLQSEAGQPFDVRRAEADAQRLAAGGDFTRTDYQLVSSAAGTGLVFELEDKSWGPHYFTVGLDLSTDFRGVSAFNLKLAHNRHWLTPNGTEWRSRLQVGEVPAAAAELYHPLAWTRSPAHDWFIAAYASIERRRLTRYDGNTGVETAAFRRGLARLGIDLGQPWGELGELRLGYQRQSFRLRPLLVSDAFIGPSTLGVFSEDLLRARVVFDQLDYANFPTRGWRLEADAGRGRRSGSLSGSFGRVEAHATVVGSWARTTFSAHLRLATADQRSTTPIGRYTLGGFHNLSGYKADQFSGNDVLLMRLGWQYRLPWAPALTRGVFAGATVEGGNVFARPGDISLSQLRAGMSLFLGADTGIGPLYVGVTHAPRGETGIAVFIGRP
ncbi:MAG: patatin-like phospholipase family protein [Aquabacterium sp.]